LQILHPVLPEHPARDVLALRGRCKNCGAPISARYFVVELLTGLMFLACWLQFGDRLHEYPSMPLALVYTVLLAGLIVATFIDFEHFIIPDEITIGGVFAGVIASFFLPQLHAARSHGAGILWGAVGALAGAGIVYGFSRLGKLMLAGSAEMARPVQIHLHRHLPAFAGQGNSLRGNLLPLVRHHHFEGADGGVD